MIFSNTKFETATEQKPSRSQLERLTNGDNVRLSYRGDWVWFKVVFIHQDDIIGKLTTPVIFEELRKDELASFTIQNIIEIVPDKDRMRLPPFMLVESDAKLPYVLHTKFPRVVAMLHLNEPVLTATAAAWLDEPEDYNAGAKVLHDIANWFYYKHVKK